MKGFNKNKYFYFVVVGILILSMPFAKANEQFQNNLLKMDFYQSALGGVKVNLYTNKPYSDSVVVNKKSDSEYVILMPETANSLTSKPSLNSVNSVVKNVNVKTQQYENKIKGYTKITISTTKPVEIIPQVHTLNTSGYQISDKDYKELMAQAEAKKIAAAKSEAKKQPVQTAPIVKKEKTAIQTKQVQAPVFVQKTIKKLIPTQEKPTIITTNETDKTLKPATKNAPQKTEIIQPTTSTVSVEKQTPTEVETTVQEEPQKAETTTSPVKTEQVSSPVQTPVPQLSTFQKYKKIIKNYIYYITGLVTALFLLLLLIARKIKRNPYKQKAAFKTQLEESPTKPVDYMENINEDMTWKEKFQTYVATTTPSTEKTAPQAEYEKSDEIPHQELDNLFAGEQNQVQEQLPEVQETEHGNLLDEIEVPQDEISSSEEGFEQDKLNEIFDEEELIAEESFNFEASPQEKELEIEEQEEESDIVKSKFIIDDGKGFYLVDFEDTTALVGQIDEEIFVLKRFDSKIEAPLQARIDEQKKNSTNYMTKIGKFKALVEVTPNNMNLLIEL